MVAVAVQTEVYAGSELETLIKEEFRNYTDSVRQARVEALYAEQHENMSYQTVVDLEKKHNGLIRGEMTMWEVILYLNNFVDSSDPDTDSSQLQHGLQTAERARKAFPECDWLHLVSLIHDSGKLLGIDDAAKNLVAEPQWAVVGDTFPVGCAWEDTVVLRHLGFDKNTDASNPVYSTKLGVYDEGVGLDNVKMSYGHDEYLYQVLSRNDNVKLPKIGLDIIRFHSFYPWHSSNGYRHLCNADDEEKLVWVKRFNQFDLYSKSDDEMDVEKLVVYYKGLCDKYMPGKLKW